jgi:transposase
MRQSNTIGFDLAKNVIQVSVVTPSNKELSNRELSRKKFAEFLAQQKPDLVAFEACCWNSASRSQGDSPTCVDSCP